VTPETERSQEQEVWWVFVAYAFVDSWRSPLSTNSRGLQQGLDNDLQDSSSDRLLSELYRYTVGSVPVPVGSVPKPPLSTQIDTDHDASPLSIWQYRGMIYHASDASAAENDVHSNTAGKEQ